MGIKELEKRIKKLEVAEWGITCVIFHGEGEPIEVRDAMCADFRTIQPDDPEYREYTENL